MLADRFTHLDTQPARIARAGLPYVDSSRSTPAVPRLSCISRWRRTCSCRNRLWKTRLIQRARFGFCVTTKTNGTYRTQEPAIGRTGHSGCRSPPRRTEAGARLRLASTAFCYYIFRCVCRRSDEILTIQAGRKCYSHDDSSPKMQIEPCASFPS